MTEVLKHFDTEDGVPLGAPKKKRECNLPLKVKMMMIMIVINFITFKSNVLFIPAKVCPSQGV